MHGIGNTKIKNKIWLLHLEIYVLHLNHRHKMKIFLTFSD